MRNECYLVTLSLDAAVLAVAVAGAACFLGALTALLSRETLVAAGKRRTVTLSTDARFPTVIAVFTTGTVITIT